MKSQLIFFTYTLRNYGRCGCFWVLVTLRYFDCVKCGGHLGEAVVRVMGNYAHLSKFVYFNRFVAFFWGLGFGIWD